MIANITKTQPKTIGVPEAGKTYFGLSRGASYAAAANGQIPTIRIGRLLRVPVVALDQLLEGASKALTTKTGGNRTAA